MVFPCTSKTGRPRSSPERTTGSSTPSQPLDSVRTFCTGFKAALTGRARRRSGRIPAALLAPAAGTLQARGRRAHQQGRHPGKFTPRATASSQESWLPGAPVTAGAGRRGHAGRAGRAAGCRAVAVTAPPAGRSGSGMAGDCWPAGGLLDGHRPPSRHRRPRHSRADRRRGRQRGWARPGRRQVAAPTPARSPEGGTTVTGWLGQLVRGGRAHRDSAVDGQWNYRKTRVLWAVCKT